LARLHLHHVAAFHHHGAAAGRSTGRRRSNRQDRKLDLERAGLFELQRRFDRFAGFERMLDVMSIR
jgi:hypothetical protein